MRSSRYRNRRARRIATFRPVNTTSPSTTISIPPNRTRMSRSSPHKRYSLRSCRCENGLPVEAVAAGMPAAVAAATIRTPFTSGRSRPRSPEPRWRAVRSTAADRRRCRARRTPNGGSYLRTILALKRRPLQAGAGILLLAVAGCAQLPTTASVAIPPIPAGDARVWFYRPIDAYDSPNTPYIRMNDAIVAISEPGGASYRDFPAGPYHITVDSYGKDFNQDKDVALVPGQEVYVKIVSLRDWIAGGGNGGSGEGGGGSYSKDTFYVWLMPPEVARADVARSAFHGS